MAELLFVSGGAGSGGAVGSSPNFVFSDFGTQDPSQGRYTDWNDLMAALALVQLGASPIVRLALTSGPFVVPLAGMPALGWNMRGGRFGSYYANTGATVLDCPAGVKFDMLFGIGDGTDPGTGSVVLKIAPPAGTGVLEFSAIPLGAGFIFSVGGGCAIDHSTDTGALFRSPGGLPSTTCVIAMAGASQNVGLVPPLTGPLLELVGDDGAVGVQLESPNGFPNGWLVGGGAGSVFVNIYDANGNPDSAIPATFVPGFTGGGGVFTPFPYAKSILMDYTPAVLADWSGVAPTSVADALNRIAAALGPIP